MNQSKQSEEESKDFTNILKSDQLESSIDPNQQSIYEEVSQSQQSSQLNTQSNLFIPTQSATSINESKYTEQSSDIGKQVFNVSSFGSESAIQNKSGANINDFIEGESRQRQLYQEQLTNKIISQWDDENDHYGSIVFMDTGTGKTHIAISLLNHLFNKKSTNNVSGQENNPGDENSQNFDQQQDMPARSEEQIRQSRRKREYEVQSCFQNQSEVDIKKYENRPKVVFIVPTQNLVDQQSATIERFSKLEVGRFHGGQKNKKFYTDYDCWKQEFLSNDVFVFMAKKFYDLLMHGFINMEELNLIVFDECHHTDQDHLYNLIMRDFFFQKFIPGETKRPKIVGLTASPIKTKIDSNTMLKDVQYLLQNLSNNLYARFATMSKSEIDILERQVEMVVETYDSRFSQNCQAVRHIEEQVIRELVNSIKMPHESYKMTQMSENASQNNVDKSQRLLKLLNDSILNEAHEEHDTQVIRFLTGQKQLIGLESTFTKKHIDIAEFKDYEDQVLLILCLIILKNINNLLIELGLYAVKTFLMEIKKELIERDTKKNCLGLKRDMVVSTVEKYCKDKDEQTSENMELSNKVERLIQILDKSYEENNKVKTIIFVKDRSVAYYLKKVLDKYQDLKQNEFQQQPKKFNIGFAMGYQSKNLVNKAYRSTNTENVSFFEDILSKMPTCGSIKMSNKELRDTIDRFKKGISNVLIATNIVEEGLDVSTCNQIICLNEIMTVKGFIQMRGRARQINSKFIFLCSKEEECNVKNDQSTFEEQIKYMKKITQSEKILPEENIIMQKQKEDDYYLQTKKGAKIAVREAKLLVDQFCQVIADMCNNNISLLKSNQEIDDSTDTIATKKQSSIASNPESEQSKTENQSLSQSQSESKSEQPEDASAKAIKKQNHMPLKPNYVIKESNKNGIKYFYCVLYMPQTCRNLKILSKIKPLNAYIKKKDAENHVALLAIRQLYEKKFLDEYLFTDYDQITQLKLFKDSHDEFELTLIKSKGLKKKPAVITSKNIQFIAQEQIQKQKNDTIQFYQAMKQSKHKVQLDIADKIINYQLYKGGDKQKSSTREVYLYVFKGANYQDNYPFTDTKDFQGVIWDKKFVQRQFSFKAYQEEKQKKKNEEHLKNQVENGLLSEQQLISKRQISDTLTISVDPVSVEPIKLDKVKIQKLKFFHTWMFYYFYSADHKFFKSLLKNKFSFTEMLFGKIISLLKIKFHDIVSMVYFNQSSHPQQKSGKKTGAFFKQNNKFSEKQLMELHAFTVPIRKTKQGVYELNWQLIEQNILYVKLRLLDLALPTEVHQVIRNYNLDQVSKNSATKMISSMWEQKLQGNRYVILESKTSSTNWSDNENNEGASISTTATDKASNDAGKKTLNHQEFYFLKQGIYLSKKFNKTIYQCRKERHFLDFGKKKKDDPAMMQMSEQQQQLMIMQQQQQQQVHQQYSMMGMSSMNQSTSSMQASSKQFIPTNQNQMIQEQSIYSYLDQTMMYPINIPNYTQNTYISGQSSLMQHQQNSMMNYSQQEIIEMSRRRPPKKINTQFEVADQCLSIAPFSYNQYQVMQQACYNLLMLDEFLLVENFIDQKFKGLKCYIKHAEQPEMGLSLSTPKQEMIPDLEKSSDIFLSTENAPYDCVTQLKDNIDLVKEALTAPSACREFDYERLEFYGDSIIGFLVILELYLTRPMEMQEGELDFLRIEKVSNMCFFKINRENKFHQFMIVEPQDIFRDFVPCSFDQHKNQQQNNYYYDSQGGLNFKTKIKHKTFNEQNNKYKEMMLIKQRLFMAFDKLSKSKEDQLTYMLNIGDFYSLVQLCIKDKDAAELLFGNMMFQTIDSLNELRKTFGRKDHESVLKACRIIFGNDISPQSLFIKTLEEQILNVQKTRDKRKQERDEKGKKAIKPKKRLFYYKQLADVVESVTGAATMRCGLNLTQDYLRKIGVLQQPQDLLKQKLEEMTEIYRKKEKLLVEEFYNNRQYNLEQVEVIINYKFECKSWLVEALTHKSIIDQSIENRLGKSLVNYERLEFLGDSVLNYLVAKHFFEDTINDKQKKMPKQLHKMKTSVVNNALLSLIVIEKKIHTHIIYNKKAQAFNEQIVKYVETVKQMIDEHHSTEECAMLKEQGKPGGEPFDLDLLYEHNLKMFGDIFESIVGAVFLDSKSILKTWEVLERLIKPYVKVYADLETLQDHSRTKLLELWNQKPYTKLHKCSHKSDIVEGGEKIKLTGTVNDKEILSDTFNKDVKNKVRQFYKRFYTVVKDFIEQAENDEDKEERYMASVDELYIDLSQIANKHPLEQVQQSRQ